MKNKVSIKYIKRHENGSVTETVPLALFGFLGAVWELWCFFRCHGTHFDDYDQMTLTFSNRDKR